MRFFLGILLCAVALAQSPGVTNTQFNPQGLFIGAYQEYEFVSCNQAATGLTVDSGQVANAARQYGISVVSYDRVELAESKQAGPSGWLWAGRIVQILSVGFTVADQVGAWKIGNEESPARWKAIIPAVGLAIPQAITWLKDNKPQTEMVPAAKRLPLFFEIPAHRCATYTVYGMVAK